MPALTDSAASSDPRGAVLDGAPAVHVGLEGRRVRDRAARGRRRSSSPASTRSDAGGLGRVVRAGGDGTRRASCARSTSKAGRLLIPGGLVGRVRARLRRARGARGVGRHVGRASAPRRPGRGCRRTLCRRRRGHGHRRLALHGLREPGGPRDAARGRRDRTCCGFALGSVVTSIATRSRGACGSASGSSRSPMIVGRDHRPCAMARLDRRLWRRPRGPSTSPAGRSSTRRWRACLDSRSRCPRLAAVKRWPGPPTSFRRRVCTRCDERRSSRVVFALAGDDARDVPVRPARAGRRTGAVDRCAAGRPRAASGRHPRGCEI